MSDVAQVDANLVGPSRFQTAPDQGRIAVPLYYLIRRKRRIAVWCNPPARGMIAVFSDRQIDFSALLLHFSVDKGEVGSFDPALPQFFIQQGGGPGVLGVQDEAGRILVESMDVTHLCRNTCSGKMACHQMVQRPSVMRLRRVQKHAGRLVHDQQMIVLVQYLDRF